MTSIEIDDFNGPTEPVSRMVPIELVRAACDSPLDYIAVLHRYLDGGLTGLSAAEQRLFLQLVRETLARGGDRVRITVRSLSEKTGFSKDTVMRAIKRLSSPEVDLVNVVSSGGPHSPAHYQIRWYTFRIPLQEGGRQRSKLQVSASPSSIESRLAELKPKDREKLEFHYQSLSKEELKGIHDRIHLKCRDLGVSLSKKEIQQCVLLEVLREKMFQYIRFTYPNRNIF